MLGNLSGKALSGLLGNDQTEIFRKCLDEAETLLAKNTDYGSSALLPPLLAPHVPPTTAILVRMSDKVQRLIQLAKHGAQVKAESFEDTLRDFSGYVKLYQIAKEREHAHEDQAQEEPKQEDRVEPEPEQSRPQDLSIQGGGGGSLNPEGHVPPSAWFYAGERKIRQG